MISATALVAFSMGFPIVARTEATLVLRFSWYSGSLSTRLFTSPTTNHAEHASDHERARHDHQDRGRAREADALNPGQEGPEKEREEEGDREGNEDVFREPEPGGDEPDARRA